MDKSNLDQLRIERKPEKKHSKIPWLWALAILVILIAVIWFVWITPPAMIEVRTVVVREMGNQPAGTVLNASGYVTARRQATVSSKLTGRVTEVLIEEGMLVEQAQVLARLDDSNVRANFELVKAQLVSAQRGLKETEALLNEAESNLTRSRQLVEKGLASEAELDRSRALAGSLQAQLERKKADVEVAARQVDIYRQQLEDTIIRAPFAGVVVAKNAQPGEMVSPVSAGGGFTRTGIGTIVDMSSLEIEIDVNEAYINRVSPGQAAMATLDAWPDWKIPCHVIAIIPTADRQRATVGVRLGFNELDERILPDMGVKVAFQEAGEETAPTTVAPSGILLPPSALLNTGGQSYVFVVSDGRAERRAVATAGKRNNDVIVVSGLEPGEVIVIEGPSGLADGAGVQEKAR